MDLRKLKTLIDLVSESNISELEITEADGKVRIVKADPHAAVMAAPVASHPAPMAAAPAPHRPGGSPSRGAVQSLAGVGGSRFAPTRPS